MLKRLAISGLSALPSGVKRRIVNVGFSLDRERFQEVATNHLFAPDMRLGLEFLKRKGVSPKSILDIGAYEGNWAKMALSVWPEAAITMIEANPEKAPIIRKAVPTGRLIETLLGPDDKVVPFHVMESGSSVMEENSPLDRKTIRLKQTTLDSLNVSADFIKMDVQGYELEVLKGGEKTLSKALAVLIELSLLEINNGCPLLDESLAFMRERGFVAYDILELHRRPLDNAMNQLDVLFVPESSPLRADKRHYA